MSGVPWMDEATFRHRLDVDADALARNLVNFEMFRRYWPHRGTLYDRDDKGLFLAHRVGAWDDAGEVETRSRSIPSATWSHLEWRP